MRIILKHSDYVNSILLLDNKNILISSGYDGTKFWNLNNFEIIKHIKETYCTNYNSLCIIDDDKIIVKGENIYTLLIISIQLKRIINIIYNSFVIKCIKLIKKKKVFLIGGISNDIKIYSIKNFKCIQLIKEAHFYYINGFINLIDNTIASFSDDGLIQIWYF